MTISLGRWLGLAALWIPVGISVGLWVANADRGLQMTDEASYLLIAQDPWNMGGHTSFYGFLLHPLWVLSGGHVGPFRLAGFFILAVATVFLGQSVRLLRATPPRDFFLRHGLWPLLLAGVFAYYADGVRTPNYNWVALVGSMVWASGLLRAWAPGGRGWPGLWGSLGWAIVLVGKWPAAFALGALWLISLPLIPADRRRPIFRFGWISLAGGLALAGVGLGGYAGPAGIWNSLEPGSVMAREIGSHDARLFLKYVIDSLNFLYRIGRAAIWLLPPLLLAAWILRRTERDEGKRFRILVTAAFGAALGLALWRGHGQGGALQWNKESLMAGLWLSGVLFLGRSWLRTGGRPDWSWILVLAGLPMGLGFGTNTSLADYAGHAVVFWSLVGWWVLAGGDLAKRMGAVGLGSALACLVWIQSARQVTALQAQWKVGPLARETEMLRVGSEAGRLRVNAQLNQDLEKLGGVLALLGFRSGGGVVAVSEVPGLVYLLGARSVGVPWYQGWQEDVRIRSARAILAIVDPVELADAWLIFAEPADQEPAAPEQIWPAGSLSTPPVFSGHTLLVGREFSDANKPPMRLRIFFPAKHRP